VHRVLNDFASETLPFRRFMTNAALYCAIMMASFPYGCFNQDVGQSVVSVTCYVTALRRRILDVVGKIVRHAGLILLKVAEKALILLLHIDTIWNQSGAPLSFQ